MLHFSKEIVGFGQRMYYTGKTETGNEYGVGKLPSGRFVCITEKPYESKHSYIFDTMIQAVRFANLIENTMRAVPVIQ
jgi:hypothetical protein